MRYRRLGQADLEVSEIGFGGWGIGGKTEYSYGETNDTTSISALHRARDLGITLFDTSPAYGRSEDLIGQSFNGSDKVIITTKVGYESWNGQQDFSPSAITASIDKSLRRLRSYTVDILLLHSPPSNIISSEEVKETMKSLVKSGKIRYWGVSAKSPVDAFEALDHGAQVIQANFNMMDIRSVTSGLLEKSYVKGAGFIARTPLCFGFLTGKITRETQYQEGDHRLTWSRAQLENWIDGASDLLAAVPERLAALRYCLSFSDVSSTIPGIMSPAEAEENSMASDLGPLSYDLLKRVEEINASRQFFVAR